MTIAVDWDVKQQNKQNISTFKRRRSGIHEKHDEASGLQIRVRNRTLFFLFSAKIYLVGAQKKHMFKLMGI